MNIEQLMHDPIELIVQAQIDVFMLVSDQIEHLRKIDVKKAQD